MYSFGRWGTSRFGGWRDVRWSRWFLVEFVGILKKKIFLLKELIFFTRPETCLFMSGIAVTGCLLFNVLDMRVVFLFLCVFFTSGTAYSINYLTDKEEDIANNEKINIFTTNGKGAPAVVLFVLVSLVSSLFLSKMSLIFYLVCLCWGLLYSMFKIKRIFLLKHFYIAMTFVITFLIGATYGNKLTVEMFAYLPVIFLFGFLLNLLGDLKGHEGDMYIGMKTVPIVFGRAMTKKVIHSIAGLFSILVVSLNFVALFPLLFFVILFSFFLGRDDLKHARLCLLSSFIFLPIVLRAFGGAVV